METSCHDPHSIYLAHIKFRVVSHMVEVGHASRTRMVVDIETYRSRIGGCVGN
jgi:hypothetical protein